MSNSWQKIGGIAAIYAGAAYIIGMIGFLGVVDVSSVADPVEKVALIADNTAFLTILYVVVYQIWSVFLVILTLALYQRLKGGAPEMMQLTAAIGIIWAAVVIASGMIYNIGMENVVNLYATNPAEAGTVWRVIESVSDGIGGGNEILGGIWALLISWAALRLGRLNKPLNYLGLLIGAAGIVSALPGLQDAGMVFGLGQIFWFIWLGMVMLRDQSVVPAQRS